MFKLDILELWFSEVERLHEDIIIYILMELTQSCFYLKWVIRIVNFKRYAFIKGEIHFLKSFRGLEIFISVSLSLLLSVPTCLPMQSTLE